MDVREVVLALMDRVAGDPLDGTFPTLGPVVDASALPGAILERLERLCEGFRCVSYLTSDAPWLLLVVLLLDNSLLSMHGSEGRVVFG